jgi:MarR-like DNA-binding transcriptional regulator SgrR of sgrS sRNA
VPTFNGEAAADIYSVEREMLRSLRLIPLIHLRMAFTLRPNVREIQLTPDGSLFLNGAWLEAAKP